VTYKKKLIEVALPLEAINRESAREKSIRHGHPSTLHLWWARRPLAAVRAVLWSSLVDDPSAHPDRFPTEEAQEEERQRLFRILEELVKWENSNNETVLGPARAEILRSCDGELPAILDPFCGGGTIPLEAQRLGLPAYGGDLNPVAVLISKAMVEIPPRFAGRPPVHPSEGDADLGMRTWERAQGLADDIRYYGKWMRDRAFERIGHLYPKVTLPAEKGGGEATVIAWIWARTVESPDPSWNGHVPLVRSWVLRKAKGKKPVVWIEPIVDRETQTIRYEIREGGEPPDGSVSGGNGRCVATGAPIPGSYIKAQGRLGQMAASLMAIVAEGSRTRVYLPAMPSAGVPTPEWRPAGAVPERLTGGTCYGYGLTEWDDLFTDRQLVALNTFSDLIDEVRPVIEADSKAAGLAGDGERLRDGGSGAVAYVDAVATYLAFAVDKCADYWSTISTWNAPGEKLRNTFARQAIPMTWDFAEGNPFSDSTGNWMAMVDWGWKVVANLPASTEGEVAQRDASARIAEEAGAVVVTDPPYYDNISYADLSDFFYVWLRRNLRDVWPDEFSTVLTPKAEELIANRYRAGSKEAAQQHFEAGMEAVLSAVAKAHPEHTPATFFYAFKQAESDAVGTASTGWETFLEGLIRAGFAVTATWPNRTEKPGRSVAIGTAALASSIVIACRPRPTDAPLATRSEFLRALEAELPEAIRLLQNESIPPVDMAQAAIGPGMAVFSRYARVIETDGSTMTVRQALVSINQALEEVLSQEETEFDAATRWALTWYRQHGLNPGPFGDAETLSKAKDTSVSVVVETGVATMAAGQVRLVDRAELPGEWDPRTDRRLSVWEVTQHLIARLAQGEEPAADLLRKVGVGMGERARQLGYLLYQVADGKGWSKEAVAYNGLGQAWPSIAQLATDGGARAPVQQRLGTEV